MSLGLGGAFGALSHGVADLVAAASPWIASVRPEPGRHAGALVWQNSTILVAADALADDSPVEVLLADHTLWTARPTVNNTGLGIATLTLPHSDRFGAPPWEPALAPRVGALVLALGINPDATPKPRLAAVDAVAPDGRLRIDLAPGQIQEGGPVLDAAGDLLGLLRVGPDAATVIPFDALRAAVATEASHPNRQAWLGLSLQPISVPPQMRSPAGQVSGRQVIAVEQGGPAELAGLQARDILLSIDGQNLSGPGAVRSLLSPERIGREVEVRLVRNGRVLIRRLVIGGRACS